MRKKKTVAGVPVSAKYNSESFAIRSLVGKDYDLGGFFVTPKAGLQYVSILNEGYTDSVLQRVSGSSSDILTAVSEINVGKELVGENANVIPSLKLGVGYDMKNDKNNTVVDIQNSMSTSSSYTSYGKALDRFELMAGAGVKFAMKNNTELSLDYTGRFRKDYDNHLGTVTFKYKF